MSDNRHDHVEVIAPPPLIYLGPLLLGLLLHRLRPVHLLPGGIARPLGWLLLSAGIAGEAWFLDTMRRAQTPIDPRKPVQRLVTSGPFAFSRNPSYTMMTAIYLGISTLVNALWPILFLPAVVIAMTRGVIEREEGYLERTFGDEYRRYKASVRRWV